MRVQDILKTKGDSVITIVETTCVARAVSIMQARAIGALGVVTSDGQLKGVISEREIIVALARHGNKTLDLRTGDLMPSRQATVFATQ